ncbi:hypothetical protein F4861DRAFT_541399 [Xylaria intraflava]|nr:hypothetical protein F4861DRAFT_541399 [Xylaria intraflava]
MADQSPSKQAEVEAKMTPADTKFLTTMFKYLPKNVQIPWDEFAKDMKLKNAVVAKIRSKLGLFAPSTDKADSGVSPIKTLGTTKVTKPRTPRKPKAMKRVSDLLDDEDLVKDEESKDRDGEA